MCDSLRNISLLQFITTGNVFSHNVLNHEPTTCS